ncbi:MAG: hypothetical protein PHD21_03245 [Flavobacteriales bacterium]|nr:hypothetical protein [Flavobacteriales bacterium]
MNSYLIIIVVVFALAAIFALIKKNLLAAGLWVVIGLGTYLLTDSIMAPIAFQDVRDARYSKVFKSLEAIGDVEKLYRTSNNKFAGSFDELYAFMDTAKVYLTQTREVSYKEYSKVYRIDITKEKKVTDTVAVVSVLEHLRKNYEKFAAYEAAHNGSYKDLRYVPVTIEGQPKTEFAISAGTVERGKNTVPVFEVSVKKNVILSDQNPDLLANENAAVVGVKGDVIKIGDMTVPTTEGNWGKEAK